MSEKGGRHPGVPMAVRTAVDHCVRHGLEAALRIAQRTLVIDKAEEATHFRATIAESDCGEGCVG